MIKISGISVAPGVAIGKARVICPEEILYREDHISSAQVDNQKECLRVAIDTAHDQLSLIVSEAEAKGETEKAEITEAHQMMLEDTSFTDKIFYCITEKNIYAETAVRVVIDEYKSEFNQMDNAYMRERATDVEDIGLRLIRNILGISQPSFGIDDEPSIIFTKLLTPTDSGNLCPDKVLAICTEEGSVTSHSAIIARMHGIPSVSGLCDILIKVRDGDPVIVDGDKGFIICNPDDEQIEEYKNIYVCQANRKEQLATIRDLPACTSDGKRQVEMSANIVGLSDLDTAIENGAEGVGLFRTEFLYMGRQTLPTEDEQYEVYKTAVEKISVGTVIFRTLDIGGDKKTPCLNLPDEENPFLGWRGIRILLDETEIFRQQIRAILRASAHGTARIMFPMISDLSELREANRFVKSCMDELDSEHVLYNPDIKSGIMIETPAAAITADLLIKETDFFSIGSNDLVQYTMAADRMNARVAKLCNPTSISVMRLIKRVIDVAHEADKWVGVCGEMAGNPEFALLLTGLGVDELSMSAPSLPSVKAAIRNITLEEAEARAAHALCCN